MSIFQTTLTACQQLDLLGEVAEQRDGLVRPVRVFLRGQMQEIREAGHKAEVTDFGASQMSLVWRLRGREAHPRDRYELRLSIKGQVTTCEFVGPTPKAVALTLSTRCLSEETLGRWAATFYEWALAVREGR